MSSPKITVLMPVYNCEKYLNEAIDSILNQTFKDFEFLIINDGSIDKSLEIIKKYKDNRIKIINNEKNLGIVKTLNRGLKLASGKYIARMDADDISMPERFEKQIEFLEKNTDIVLVGTAFNVINENGKLIEKRILPTSPEEIKKKLIKANILCHPSVMFIKKICSQIGLYDENWQYVEDYDFYFRVANKFKMANLKQVLFSWRVNMSGTCTTRTKIQKEKALKLQLRAISDRQYSSFYYYLIIRSFIINIIPYFLRKFIKKYILKRKLIIEDM
ncbi:MAG: glycosyltransferase [Patescibacteria group bacterium]|nr:glycosyltransferase [Patescibacteria group bacterium]MBU1350138.1 glycosyltransferase [Patescibacteria group bacterium]MBU2456291.1 glycosyltransferase [Patescibacteria group bacterium]MBU2474821.1 glycosyltransferase [Patescibacteria group bacterium]